MRYRAKINGMIQSRYDTQIQCVSFHIAQVCRDSNPPTGHGQVLFKDNQTTKKALKVILEMRREYYQDLIRCKNGNLSYLKIKWIPPSRLIQDKIITLPRRSQLYVHRLLLTLA